MLITSPALGKTATTAGWHRAWLEAINMDRGYSNGKAGGSGVVGAKKLLRVGGRQAARDKAGGPGGWGGGAGRCTSIAKKHTNVRKGLQCADARKRGQRRAIHPRIPACTKGQGKARAPWPRAPRIQQSSPHITRNSSQTTRNSSQDGFHAARAAPRLLQWFACCLRLPGGLLVLHGVPLGQGQPKAPWPGHGPARQKIQTQFP